jgi:hypothetical protein
MANNFAGPGKMAAEMKKNWARAPESWVSAFGIDSVGTAPKARAL